MPQLNQDAAPLLDCLKQAKAQDLAPFHMPGHRHAEAYPEPLPQLLLSLDTTEYEDTDNLNDPGPALSQAQELAADLWEAGACFFLSGGSSQGIKAAVLACQGRGDRLALPRLSHVAACYAATLAGLTPLWLPAEDEAPRGSDAWLYPLPQPDLQQAEAILQKHAGQIRALLLTSPDYYGNCLAFSRLASLCHQLNLPLIVDQAHGAYFCRSAQPLVRAQDALKQGADVVIYSAHKTLAALTPAALLMVSRQAVSSGLLSLPRLRLALSLIGTTSPSLLTAATLDYARRDLALTGPGRSEAVLLQAEVLQQGLPPQLRLSPLKPRTACGRVRDPQRLLLSLQPGLRLPAADAAPSSGCWLYRFLSQQGVKAEMHDIRRVVLLPSLYQKPADWQVLAAALTKAGQALAAAQPETASGAGTRLNTGPAPAPDAASDSDDRGERLLRQLYTLEPQTVYPPSCALSRQPRAWLPLADCSGRITAQALLPYPPGIPLVWPGERLQPALIRGLSALAAWGVIPEGMPADPDAWRIPVLD